MKKIFINIICAFIPKKEYRHYLRKKIKNINPDFVVTGQNNRLVLIDEQGNEKPMMTNIPGMKINVQGDNNTIKIHLPLKPSNSFIDIGNHNAYIELGPTKGNFNVHIAIKCGEGQKCVIGKSTTIGNCFIALTERAQCLIGEDCMLSGMIRIYAADGHSVLDAKTGKVLNRADTPLITGNHVWIGEGARITKRAHIYDNCVVAGGAVAYKDYKESGVIIAGNPGKLLSKA